MPYQKSIRRLSWAGTISAHIVGKSIVPLIVVTLLVMPQYASAYSMAGTDWKVNLDGYLTATGLASLMNQAVTQTNAATSIVQSSASNIVIPLNIEAVSLTFNVPGTISGSHVMASQADAGPYFIPGYSQFRLRNITAHLEGDITGSNPLDTTGGFGARAYTVTGNPTSSSGPTSYITIADYDVDLFGTGNWTRAGSAKVDVYSWSATRGEGVVPEPGTITMLVSLAMSLAAYGWWRRRTIR
jgi:hypothetical protein